MFYWYIPRPLTSWTPFKYFIFFFAMIRTSDRVLNANSLRGLYLIQRQIQHEILNTDINWFVLKFWTALCIPWVMLFFNLYWKSCMFWWKKKKFSNQWSKQHFQEKLSNEYSLVSDTEKSQQKCKYFRTLCFSLK